MTKNEKVQPVTLKCRDCGHDRFQAHERGKFYYEPDNKDGEYRFEYDETAVQCLACHHVCLLTELVKPE